MNKKILYKIIPVILMICIIMPNIFCYVNGFGNGFDPTKIQTGEEISKLKTPVNRAWGTISLILQMCAVGGIIFAGVRYMFATADAKSDIKKTLPYIIIGCVIVFAAPYIINFITLVFKQATGT